MGEVAIIPLLTPYQMGTFPLSIRMVYAPLTRSRALGTVPQPAAATYYSQRAQPGGLMLTEGTVVAPEGQGYPNTPGIYTQEQVEAWKPIVAAAKERGAVFFCQLWHVGRASHQEYQPGGALPLGPSAVGISSGEQVYISTGPADFPVPRAMTHDDIAAAVQAFRQAARHAIDVGFDGVEIHGATGYLIEQFLKAGSNKRTDEYGGSVENRCRLAVEIAEAVAAEVGPQRVGIRLSPFSTFLDSHDPDPVPLYLHLLSRLSALNLLYVHFIESRIQGNTETEGPSPESLEPFRKAWKGTFIAAGGFKRDTGNEAIASCNADLITFGRLFLANPDLPRRFELNAPLNKYDRSTFYSPDQVKGYTDYPFLDEVKAAAAK